jgi:type VI secretion system secreted protein Hcp
MKFGGVLGDAQDPGHTNWIQLKTVSWDLSRPVTNPAGSSAGRVLSAPQVAELHITKDEDVASIPLVQAAFEGSPVAAQIDFCATGTGQQTVYYTIVLTNAIITVFGQSAADGRPIESLAINFTQIAFTGTQMDADGTTTSPASYGWNISTNTST